MRSGGFVVYSTCTLTKRENRDVVEGFLASSAGEGFALEDLSAEVPEPWRHFVAEEGWFQSVPELRRARWPLRGAPPARIGVDAGGLPRVAEGERHACGTS